MKVTDNAAGALLGVMERVGLDKTTWSIEIKLVDGYLSMGWTRDKIPPTLKVNDLKVVIAPNIDTTGVVMDYIEIDGKKGLTFEGEK